MISKIFLIVILILVVLIVMVGMAGLIALLFLTYGEDPDHENSVSVSRGTTMGATRKTNISRTGKK